MADDKKSFVVYHDIKEVIDGLTDEQVGKLFRSMVNYSVSGTELQLDGVLRFIFIPIRQQMDRDSTKWEGIREKRAEAGRKGGIKSGESRRKANALFALSNEANEAVNVNANVNGNVNVNGNGNATTTATVTNSGGSGGYDDEYNIWKMLGAEGIDAVYDEYPNTGGLLLDKIYEDIKVKQKKVKSPLAFVMGYAKKVGWTDEEAM